MRACAALFMLLMLLMLLMSSSTDLLAQSGPLRSTSPAGLSLRSDRSRVTKPKAHDPRAPVRERASSGVPEQLSFAPPPLDLRPTDAWLHAGSSASIQLMGYGGLRALSVAQRDALVISIGVTLAAGIGKELHDRAGHGDASTRDLFWDVVGTGIGVVLARFADR